MQPVRTESEAPITADTKTEDGNSKSIKEARLPSDNSVMEPLDNPVVLAEQVVFAIVPDEV